MTGWGLKMDTFERTLSIEMMKECKQFQDAINTAAKIIRGLSDRWLIPMNK